MNHEIDDYILSYESTLGKDWPFFEKRYFKIFCFYISFVNGRFYFRIAREKNQLLINVKCWQKDLAFEKLPSVFKQIIKTKK